MLKVVNLINGIICFACLQTGSVLWAQNFVTDTKDEIEDYLGAQNVGHSIARASDGTEYLHFMDGEITVQYRFDEEDTCVSYFMFFPELGLMEAINGLDAAFERVNERKWREFDGRHYFIWLLDRTDDGYRISVTAEIH